MDKKSIGSCKYFSLQTRFSLQDRRYFLLKAAWFAFFELSLNRSFLYKINFLLLSLAID